MNLMIVKLFGYFSVVWIYDFNARSTHSAGNPTGRPAERVASSYYAASRSAEQCGVLKTIGLVLLGVC